MLPLIASAEKLTSRGVRVTLLTDCPLLYYSGMVPEYLGGVYTHAQVTIRLALWCARAGVAFVEGTAAALDAEARTVTTADGRVVDFDLAAFDIGAVNPQRDAAPDAVLTKPLHHIEALEQRVRAALEAPSGSLHVAVVGGGAAGVEVAFNLSARALSGRPGALRLTILEPSAALLPGFPDGMQQYAHQTLAARGVTIRTNAEARSTTPEGVVLASGDVLAADAVLWATGSSGPPLFAQAGLPTDTRGFVRVEKTLQVEGHPHLFAAGDCAVVEGHENLARIGVHAVKQGPVLRDNVMCMTAVEDASPSRLRAFTPYPIAPLILSTGGREGLWTTGDRWFKGRPVLRLKHAVDRRWMRKYLLDGRYDTLFDARAAGE